MAYLEKKKYKFKVDNDYVDGETLFVQIKYEILKARVSFLNNIIEFQN